VSARKLVEVRIPAQAAQLRLLRHVVQDASLMCGCKQQVADNLALAVNEAGMNIIQHAYKHDPAGEIVLEIHDNDSELTFTVTDFAQTVDYSCIQPRPLDEIRPGGLGTHFIKTIMDDVVYRAPDNGVGNQVIMKKSTRNT